MTKTGPKRPIAIARNSVTFTCLVHTGFQLFRKRIDVASDIQIIVLIILATREGSGESGYPRSLTRVFAVRTDEVWK